MARWNLRQRLQSPTNLRRSWDSIHSRHPDSQEVQEFSLAARHNIAALSRLLRAGSFKFGKYRARILRQKKKRRPIMEAPIRDKIVQTTMLRLIYPSLRSLIENEVSFGSVRDRTIEMAARRIVDLRQQGYAWVFESDIIKFFDQVDRGGLAQRIFDSLNDRSIDDILIQAVNAELENADIFIGNEDIFPGPGVGIPQGSVLSPLFANLYLAAFDAQMLALDLKMVRYVDDFIILCRSEAEAASAFVAARDALARIGLKIHPLGEENENGKIKTRVTRYDDDFDFLGITFSRSRLQPARDKIDRFNERIEELTRVELDRGETILDRLNRLNRVLRGWGNAYRFCNVSPIYTTMDSKVRERVSWMLYKHWFTPKKTLTEEQVRALGVRQLADIKLQPIHQAAPAGAAEAVA